ncbi:MAG: hypothetical protein JSY10_30045 [Paenibacillus sp.]|nr:hypothetical protein [Paenibacillus sp.]
MVNVYFRAYLKLKKKQCQIGFGTLPSTLSIPRYFSFPFYFLFIYFESMIHDTTPGSFPLTQRKVKKGNYISKLKTYFHHTEKQITTEKKYKNSKWNNFWKRKSERVEISNTVAMGTAFSLSVPITISNTTSHYHSKTDSSVSTQSGNSIIQQFVILSPFQIYGFMFLVALFLLVVFFGLLQVHRTISIIELGVEGIKYILTNFTSLFSFLLGLK